jgi:phenylalanyl-tRNA synthetase alpha chain
MSAQHIPKGRLHPITIATRDIAEIFRRMGFGFAHGPEREEEWYNFSALNVPADHPARDMQDTFWTDETPRRAYCVRTPRQSPFEN